MEFRGYCSGAKLKVNCAAFDRNKVTDITIPVTKNGAITTGRYPNGKFLAVIDIDGEDLNSIILTELHIPQTYVVRSAGGGFHIYFWIIDGEPHNVQGVPLTLFAQLHNIKGTDIRGKGGLIFAEGCKFDDHNGKIYKRLRSYPVEEITIEMFQYFAGKLIDYSAIEKKKTVRKQKVKTKMNFGKSADVDWSEGKVRMRQGFKDIWSGKYMIDHETQIETGVREFLYWSGFWRECYSLGCDITEVMDELEKTQPEFNRATTLKQLETQRFLNLRPTREFYYKLFPDYKVDMIEEIILAYHEMDTRLEKLEKIFDRLCADIKSMKYRNDIAKLGDYQRKKSKS